MIFKRIIVSSFLMINSLLSLCNACIDMNTVLNSKTLYFYNNKVYDSLNYKHPGGKKYIDQLLVDKDLDKFMIMPKYDFHVNDNQFTRQLQQMYVNDLCLSTTPTQPTYSTPTQTIILSTDITTLTTTSFINNTTTQTINTSVIPSTSSSTTILQSSVSPSQINSPTNKKDEKQELNIMTIVIIFGIVIPVTVACCASANALHKAISESRRVRPIT